jgi:hypothetical protein
MGMKLGLSHIKGITYTEGICEHGAEEDICTQEDLHKRRLKKIE